MIPLHIDRRSCRHGFTLVELLLALGLSVMILGIAFSGIRVTEQYCQIVSNIGTQNALLITAIDSALENRDLGNTLPAPVYSTFAGVQNRPPTWPIFGAGPLPSGNVDFIANGQCPDINSLVMHDPFTGTRIELEIRINAYK